MRAVLHLCRFACRLMPAIVLAALLSVAQATAQEIKIGFSMSLTGPLAANGKMSLVAMKIWEEDVNAKGGLMGRPVKLIYYDDQSSPAQVPGCSDRRSRSASPGGRAARPTC